MIEGPRLWEHLHEGAILIQHACPQVIDLFMNHWLQEVEDASGTCNCRTHFEKVMEDIPITYDAFPAWTWRAHNRVNSKLGKATFTWQDFKKKWSYHGQKYPQKPS